MFNRKTIIDTIYSHIKPKVLYHIYIADRLCGTFLTLDKAIFSYLQHIGCESFDKSNIYDGEKWIYNNTFTSRDVFPHIWYYITEIPVDTFTCINSTYRYSFIPAQNNEYRLIRYTSKTGNNPVPSMGITIDGDILRANHDGRMIEYKLDTSFEWTPTKEFLAFDKTYLNCIIYNSYE
jgi:hypothetical protein